MIKLIEMDENVTLRAQMEHDAAPVILVNTFTIAPGDIATFLEAWERDASLPRGA
ncbi:MAG: hypothetical protein ACREM8_09105 [Vulcanimicrobiaceae bacterium]